jgi:hypothetical protein
MKMNQEQQSAQPRKLMSRKDAAAYLLTSTSNTDRKAEAGLLTRMFVGPKRVVFYEDEVLALLTNTRNPA